ncbi:ABC transporter ATP-binding protein [Pseudomonas sp. LRF_L74]|uniref:ABC transporter ATP-binding protein n=1 Tax=Pseudomonas sp. LRF_L74 TaxID=3369422 RepID=UPI003F5D571C
MIVLSYLRPYWRSAALAPLLMMLEVAMDLMQPLLMSRIVDQGVLRGDLAIVWQTAPWMLVCAILGLLGGFGCTVFSSRAAIDVATDLRRDLLTTVQHLPLKQMDTIGQGSLVTRLTSDVAQFQQFTMLLLRIFIRAPFLALGSLALAAWIDWRLALLIVLAMPLLAALLYLITQRSAQAFGQVQNRLDQLNEGLRENIASIRTLKTFANRGHEQQRFEALNRDYSRAAVRAWRSVALNGPTLLLLNAVLVAVLWLGTGRTHVGELAVGELAAFISYLGISLGALNSLGNLLMQVARTRIALQRIKSIFARAVPTALSASRPITGTAGEIRVDAVDFAYGNGTRALSEISFRVGGGQRVALLGWTGAGKTSLLSLLAGLYPPDSGEIRIAGVPLSQWPKDQLYRHVGMVSQQPLLFSASIRENLLLGRTDIDEQRLRQASRIAQADAFIEALPQGYETQIDRQGGGLSGGQRQRLAIARALLAQPELLLLDDCSSALDPHTERNLFAAMREALPHSTWIIATQRLDKIQDSDWVLVLDDGRLIAQGTPDTLQRESMFYRTLLNTHERGQTP